MRKYSICLLLVLLFTYSLKNASTISFHDLTAVSINGEEISFSRYRGKKLLIVNVASECGYTPQYTDLEILYKKYKSEEFEILAFPSNDFGAQEPGTNEEINLFCKRNYGVTFQLFQKISVIGPKQHSIYKWLSDKSVNGWNSQTPTWNFYKYLIDKRGKLEKFYSSDVLPFDSRITQWIEK